MKLLKGLTTATLLAMGSVAFATTTNTSTIETPTVVNTNTIEGVTLVDCGIDSQCILIDSDWESAMPNLAIDSNGTRDILNFDEVDIFPTSVDKDSLISSVETIFPNGKVNVTNDGILYAIDGGILYYAYLDYFIDGQSSDITTEISYETLEAENVNGMSVINVTYPNTQTQKLYLFNTPLKTINR